MPWSSGDSLSPSNLNNRGASATSVAGYSSNTIRAETGQTVSVLSAVKVLGPAVFYSTSDISSNFTGTSFAVKRNNLKALEHQSYGSYNALNFFPPLDLTRMRLQFFHNTSATAGTEINRPYSFEVHGSEDSDAPENHIHAYSIDDSTTKVKLYQVKWGSDWDGTVLLPSLNAMKFFSLSGFTIAPSFSSYSGTGNILTVSDGSASQLLQVRADGRLRRVSATSAAVCYETAVGGEAQSRFQVNGIGTMIWGGGAATQDTNLYRHSANRLQSDDSLTVLGQLGVGGTQVTPAPLYVSGATIRIGTAFVPASGTASGAAGDICWGTNSGTSYLYVCASTDSWMRAALSPF